MDTQLGKLYSRLGKNQKAIESYEEAVRGLLNAKNHEGCAIFYDLAKCYFNMKNYSLLLFMEKRQSIWQILLSITVSELMREL
jgi:hypothetical protein